MQNTFSADMSKLNSINKIKFEWLDEQDGTVTLHIDWDETDPDLQWWTDLDPENQKAFIIDSLYSAVECYVD